MDLATFHWLLTPSGQALIAAAEALGLGDLARLASLEQLRRRAIPERAAAAYETALLRSRAAAKFPQASRMYFTREALEQASSWPVAAWRARRFVRLLGAGAAVADLCCGIGGDALALASEGLRVTAVDRDEVRLAMLQANAAVLGLEAQVNTSALDLELRAPPAAAAIFFDPARRSGGRRVFALADYTPPVALIRRWQAATPAIGVKVAPGVRDEELLALGVPEAEWISLDGELKEAALWFGPLAEEAEGGHGPVVRRATLLISEAGDDRVVRSHTLVGAASPPAPVIAEPQGYLYEPDPAIIRAHLVSELARQIDAAQLDFQIAYLTAQHAITTPFARCWRVLEWLPFGLKRLKARLRMLDAGAVTVKKRGSPLDTDALARSLSGGGAQPLVVTLTQLRGKPIALICEGPIV